jgi:2-iminobutanoate/2-iminopropanoate deaminase
MASNQVTESLQVRASETSRKQRDGSKFIGGYGKKTGDSDLLFIEGQLPEYDGKIARDESPSRQLELCIENLEEELSRHGREVADILQLTLYLADMSAYEPVNETYEQFFDETYPARSTIGVCELLGGASVTVDAVVAVE